MSLQWRPNEKMNLFLDATASEKDKFRQYSQNEIGWRRSELVPGTAVVDQNNTIVEAEFSEVSFLTRSAVRQDTEELEIYNFGTEYMFNDRFLMSSALSYTSNSG